MSSMFSSIFSRDPAKDFGYELGDVIAPASEQRVWELHHAKKKGSGESFTILVADLANLSDSERTQASLGLKRLKTMKHPSILGFVDALESDKALWVVTESVVPLDAYLKESGLRAEQRELAVSWGLYQVGTVVKFLVEDAKLVHNNLGSHSVFVTSAGEWRLGGLEFLLSPADISAGSLPRKPSALDAYAAPEANAPPRQAPWVLDSWGLGCLVWEAFNGVLPSAGALRSPRRIPASLEPLFKGLTCPTPQKRLSPAHFLSQGRRGFLKNVFVDTLLFLEEFQLKEAREKAAFFGTLKDQLDLFPADIAKRKILPQLVHAYQYGEAGSSVLAPLFRLGKLLSEEEYQKEIVPCVVKLFSSSDRATRVKLLDRIEDFVAHLTPAVVNDKIFPQLLPGFMDTNPAVRESTVKAMINLAPKLSHGNLNVELMKHFARLQSPAEPQQGIRTNTTICLGKIGSHLHPKDREKILGAAFTRALKDPFPPARSAGILGLSATQQYYRLSEVAHKILPALCGTTMDPEKQVRDQGFKALRGFLEKLEKASDNPELIPELESQVSVGAGSLLSADKVPAWAGWALGALSGRFYKSPPPPAVKEPSAASGIQKSESSTSVTSSSRVTKQPDVVVDADGWGSDGGDDDDWGSLEEPAPKTPSTAKEAPTTTDSGSDWGGSSAGGWDDLVAPPPAKPKLGQRKTSAPKKPDPTETLLRDMGATSLKPKAAASDAEAGWGGGWDDEAPSSKAKPSPSTRNEERKAEIARRRAEKASAPKTGAMKLGAKKVNSDDFFNEF